MRQREPMQTFWQGGTLSVSRRKRVAVLISGRGSNLEALAHAMRGDDYPARLELTLSSNPAATGVTRARELGLPTETVVADSFGGDREAFDAAIEEHLERNRIELVCLAGFMHILGSGIVRRWRGRMLNIHPSLLPAYPGLNTHARVLAERQKKSGCTVHFVTEKLDAGPIIAQKTVPVHPDDGPESLAARVLAAEHCLYPKALAMVARKEAVLQGEQVVFREPEPGG